MSITQSVTTEELKLRKGAKFASADEYRIKFVWRNIALMAYLHIISIYGLYLFATKIMWLTAAWGEFVCHASSRAGDSRCREAKFERLSRGTVSRSTPCF